MFGADRVDYVLLIKMYEGSQEETRYSPARCTGIDQRIVTGNPDPEFISTSYVECQNLTMRMGMRRFTRLTIVENHAAGVSLHFMYYNFARPHMTSNKRYRTKTTPTMAAGVVSHVWSVWEIAGLLDGTT